MPPKPKPSDRPQLHLVSPHMKGQPVKDLQWLLTGHAPSVWRHGKVKYPIAYKLPVDGEYGPRTASCVKGAKHWLGYPEDECDQVAGGHFIDLLDGDAKPTKQMLERRTRRIADAKRHTTSKARVVAIAQTQVGYRETPVNYTKFGQWYGINPAPWCAMFASWCYHQAGLRFHYSYVGAINTDAILGRNGLHVTGQPEPGDLFTIGADQHVGMFRSWGRAGFFNTVEGNSGDAVANNTRSRFTIAHFVRVTPVAL